VRPQPSEAALISVYDRTGVVALARALAERGVPLFATRRSSTAA
jgi:AICAR transformylase/IMP cyclohydrolase PurH